ncbi:MAG: hypothetical protein SVN78_01400 [Deferribacterota bacterium]|nr:hypothetical protein [Deferribacterota bacterium]
MSTNVIIFILFIIQILSLVALVYYILKFRLIEKRIIDVSYNDIQVIVEYLKDLLIEAERVAESLELDIRKKEDMIADLVSLLELKLIRFENAVSSSYDENNVKKKVINFYKENRNPNDIARELGISKSEVELMLKFNKEKL